MEANPITTLTITFNDRYRISPSCNSLMLSYENVENVVNPPQKPVVRKMRHSGVSRLPFSESAKRTPIRKQPTMFTVKVPSGKDVVNCRARRMVTR